MAAHPGIAASRCRRLARSYGKSAPVGQGILSPAGHLRTVFVGCRINQVVTTVLFHRETKIGGGPGERGQVIVDGRRYTAWWSGASTAHTTCWITDDEVCVQFWRYHPQCDAEPDIRVVRFARDEYCGGTGQAIVAEELGASIAADILADACAGRVAAVPTSKAAARGAVRSRSDALSTRFLLIVGVSLTLWRAGAAIADIGADGSLWWHARVASDLVPVTARVISHDLREYSGDGSWGHKGSLSTRRNWHYAQPLLELEYRPAAGAPVIRSTRAIAESFERNDAARAYLESRFPIGGAATVLVLPGQPERFLFSVDEAPGLSGLLLRALRSLATFLVIELPLIVLFTLFVLPGLGSIFSWPLRYLRA